MRRKQKRQRPPKRPKLDFDEIKWNVIFWIGIAVILVALGFYYYSILHWFINLFW